MNLSLETGIPALTVFLQGLLSFFSPCVLPLLPLYLGYLSGGAKSVDENGNFQYNRGKVLLNTIFFVLGISFTFVLLGLSFTAVGRFFHNYQTWFTRVGGIVVILFGLYQLGLFGSPLLDREKRLPMKADKLAMNPLTALILGFTFSFAWTPCVGPALATVLLLAASSASSMTGFLLIGVYTLGFVLPFLAVSLFTGALLAFFKKHRQMVKYTVKVGGVLMLLIGIMMFTGWMNHISSYLSNVTSNLMNTQDEPNVPEQDVSNDTEAVIPKPATPEPVAPATDSAEAEAAPKQEPIAAPEFTLTDQYGNTHTLADYKGKTIFLNFWATWCPPCKAEMPDIQALYEAYGENSNDLIILGAASPLVGREGSIEDITAFMEENEYTYPVVMDVDGTLAYQYAISAYPTTFMIDKDGNVFGYVAGQLSKDIMESIIKQTMEGVLK